MVIDSFSAFDKCYYYGKVWIAWLNKEINTDEFIEIVDILQNIFITDLERILYHSKDRASYKNEDRLYNCGFLARKNISISYPMNSGSRMVEVDKDVSRTKEYVENFINHMKQPYVITKAGKNLTNILTKK